MILTNDLSQLGQPCIIQHKENNFRGEGEIVQKLSKTIKKMKMYLHNFYVQMSNVDKCKHDRLFTIYIVSHETYIYIAKIMRNNITILHKTK